MTETMTEKRGAERRTAGRRQPTLGTVCRMDPQDGKGPEIGLVWNISTGGVSMLYSDTLECGATLTGVLTTSTDGFSVPVTMRVAHVAKLQTGDYLIGTQFDKPLAGEEIRHFLPEAPAVR
jgi:hypothetical protein